QNLMTIVQNAVPHGDLGVGTASLNFFRTLGGSIGATIALAILNSRLVVELHRVLPDGTVRSLDAAALRGDPKSIAALPADVGHPIATQMVNFVYVIGDKETGEALVVDPAYAVGDLLRLVESDGLKVVGALATHHHPDHVGGSMMGWSLEGVAELLGAGGGPV